MSSDKNNDIAIELTGLGKCYPIYNRPSDRLKQMLMRGRRQYYKEFWALNNVSFTIRKGETVGIIGRNGSGKSTLLQMICGTLNPTVGDVKINGRVAALLELGAGFNPEFSGVENVYMAAALYGLKKEEVDRRFEAITAFADIGEHINQPVKNYSSGMYVRLAFAVIAHVDADILVIDEALAVGDAIFTQKCMRFIRKFKENGTLLFVSHDMASVLSLCESVIWLDAGHVLRSGPAKDVSDAYMQYTLQKVYGEKIQLQDIERPAIAEVVESTERQVGLPSIVDYEARIEVKNNLSEANGWKTGGGEIVSVNFRRASQVDPTSVHLVGGEEVRVEVTAVVHQDMRQPILGFLVRDRLGQDLFGENTLQFTQFQPMPARVDDKIRAEFVFKLPMLPNGRYSVMTSLADGDITNHVQHHWLQDSLIFEVMSSKVRYGLVGVDFKRIEFSKI